MFLFYPTPATTDESLEELGRRSRGATRRGAGSGRRRRRPAFAAIVASALCSLSSTIASPTAVNGGGDDFERSLLNPRRGDSSDVEGRQNRLGSFASDKSAAALRGKASQLQKQLPKQSARKRSDAGGGAEKSDGDKDGSRGGDEDHPRNGFHWISNEGGGGNTDGDHQPFPLPLPEDIDPLVLFNGMLPPPSQLGDDEDPNTDPMKRIFGGSTPTDPTKWLSFGMILHTGPDGRYYRTLCGATLIAPRWALSAGHCRSYNTLGDKSKDLDALWINPDGPWQIIPVVNSYEHPYHRPGAGSSWDFLLLELKWDAHNMFWGSIPRLADRSYVNSLRGGNIMMVAGMGETSYKGDRSLSLREASVRYVKPDVCGQWSIMGRYGFENDTMICAGGDGKSDTCAGDSGGPLMHKDGEGFVLTGVVSWGVRCGTVGYPGVYSNVAAALSWIVKKVQGYALERGVLVLQTVSITSSPTSDPRYSSSRHQYSTPSSNTTTDPSNIPSRNPSLILSSNPTSDPSYSPSINSSLISSSNPTIYSSNNPSRNPSLILSSNPTSDPSYSPSRNQSSNPRKNPSRNPSLIPSSNPTSDPS